MTQPDDRRDLPPEQDAVRRLLAEARHDEPVPPGVAAHLDAVLAELAADRRAGEEGTRERDPAPVVDLAARRRRGIAQALLAAAAIVVVAGLGVGQVLERSGSTDDSAAAGAGSDGGGDASFGETESDTESDASADAPLEDPAAESSRKEAELATAPPPVSSDTLRRDLRDALRSRGGVVAQDEPTCALAEETLAGEGRRVPITFDGQPALALYRVPQGARRQVEVYVCGSAAPTVSVSLRAP